MTCRVARVFFGFGLSLLLTLPQGLGCGDDDGGSNLDAGADAAQVDAAVDATSRYEPTELSIQNQMQDLNVPGAAFAIIEGGEITHAVGYGRKHPDAPAGVEPTTLFRIASVTKMMTAVGLLQQVEAGAVSLDASMVDFLPGFVFTADATTTAQVTVQHLLTHTSGLVDLLTHDATADYQDASALHDYTYEVFAEVGFFQAPPGRMYNYTNPGFCLAGLLIEQATGEHFGPYLENNVFLPLGMDRTTFSSAEVLADGDYAVGRVDDTMMVQQIGASRAEPDTYDNPWAWPAGYAFSSVLDLAQFVMFLRNGDPAVLSDGLQSEMQRSQINTHYQANRVHYGYGLLRQDGIFVGEDFYDITVISHNGAIAGFSSELSFVPECDLGFVTLANTNGGYFSDSLEVLIETLCDLPAPVTAPDLAADPLDHPDFVGTYHEPQYFGDMIVTEDGTALRIDIPTLTAGFDYDPVLVPTYKDNYVMVAWQVPYGLTFIRDPSGQADFLRHRAFVGRRAAPGAAPAPPPRSPHPRIDLARQLRRTPRLHAPLSLPRSLRQRLPRLLRPLR